MGNDFLELNESISLSDFIAGIKTVPKKVVNIFKKNHSYGKDLSTFVIDVENLSENDDMKKAWEKYKGGKKLDEKDVFNIKNFIKKYKNPTLNFIFGILTGIGIVTVPLVILFLDLTLLSHYLYTFGKTEDYKILKREWKRDGKIRKEKRKIKREIKLEEFKNKYPVFWKNYERYIIDSAKSLNKKYKKIKRDIQFRNAPYPETVNGESDTYPIIPTTIENNFVSYKEFKKINESILMVLTAGSLAAIIGYGFGKMVGIYINIWKRRKTLEIAYKHEADPDKKKTLKKRLAYYKTKEVKIHNKLQNKLEDLKNEKKYLSSLPKHKQEEAKEKAKIILSDIDKVKEDIEKLRKKSEKRNIKQYNP